MMGAVKKVEPQVKEGGIAVELLYPENIRVAQCVGHIVGLSVAKRVIST